MKLCGFAVQGLSLKAEVCGAKTTNNENEYVRVWY